MENKKAKIIPTVQLIFIIFGVYSFVISTGWMGTFGGGLGFAIFMSILLGLFKYGGLLLAIGGFILVFSNKVSNKKTLIILSSILLLMTTLLFYTQFRVNQFIKEKKLHSSYDRGFTYYLDALRGIDSNESNKKYNERHN